MQTTRIVRIAFAIGSLAIALLPLAVSLPSQQAQSRLPSASAAGTSALTADKAIALAEQGRCKEALPALRRIVATTTGAVEGRRTAGIAGLRCSMTIDSVDSTLDFVKLLEHQFPNDPDVLFVLVHTYSDLSTRVAQELGRNAPNS
ncbi:MAG TPA: hypothetical protein VH022_06355, partial [Candidatus Acidoferrum sp.]|nr:hypothetical protein [Candidatus Acidoferrum sp.]